MLREEIGKWLRKLLSKGARPDIEDDLQGEGIFHWAMNMRAGQTDGTIGSREKVGTQRTLFPPDPGEEALDASYICIGSILAGNDIVSFHASSVVGLDPKVKVNGTTMAQSPVIPYTSDRPLQLRSLDRRQGAIVLPADGNATPLFWDIEAMKAAYLAGEQTWFSQLSIDLISVTQRGFVEWPEFMGLVSTSHGAKTGQYIFRLRYVDDQGNRTSIGPPTPMIPVPLHLAPYYWPGSRQFPGAQTIGGPPQADDVNTGYGIKLRFNTFNTHNASFVELLVTKFNSSQGLSDPGETEVVGRITIAPGQYQKHTFIYPADNNAAEVLGADEAEQQFVNFTAPKSVETVDNRVLYANFRIAQEKIGLTFIDDGGTTFPITKRVATIRDGVSYDDGFADPRNAAYDRSALHNERYGIGVMGWTSAFSRSFVEQAAQSVTMPERARRKSGDSLKYSSDPIYRTNTECQGNDPVSPTFDAVVQGTTPRGLVNEDFTTVWAGYGFNPLRPASPFDTQEQDAAWRIRKRVNSGRWIGDGTQLATDTGNIFAPQIHSLGIGVRGIENVEQDAPDVEVFSVMRTQGAGRVVSSGHGVWRLNYSEDNARNNKSNNRLWCYFPDIASSIVPSTIAQDFEDAPSKYRMKFTPFGAYSEVYHSDALVSFADKIDAISFLDMQNDPGTDMPRSVNVGEPPGLMGVQPTVSAPADLTNNVGYQGWRILTSDIPAGTVDTNSADYLKFMDPDNADQGAVALTMNDVNRTSSARGNTRWEVVFDDRIYRASDYWDSGDLMDFNGSGVRKSNGPMWVVDLLSDDADVPSLDSTPYVHTGTHIATRRAIGIVVVDDDGIARLDLFHARPYDAIPRTPADRRYAYVTDPATSVERRWMHIGNNTAGTSIPDIVTAIQNNGFWTDPDGNDVYGIYTSETYVGQDETWWSWRLMLGGVTGIPAPPEGFVVTVKYDNREPILSWGFDGTVSGSVWSASDDTGSYRNAMGLPHRGTQFDPAYLAPRTWGNPGDYNSNSFNYHRGIRQWSIYGHLVTRTPLMLGVADDSGRYTFPSTHYVMRPMVPVSYDSGAANGFNPLYDEVYPGEAALFDYGGFRTVPAYNLTYARPPLVAGLSAPFNWSEEQYLLHDSIIASERYNPLSKDSPGLRTFYSDNLFHIDESTGEIKRLAILDSGGRQNLFGWTDNGEFYVPYNAQGLIDADGNLMGTQSISQFWPRKENWIYRNDHGMPGELWRISVDGNIPVGSNNVDTVLWADRASFYDILGGSARDIAIDRVRSMVGRILAQAAPIGDGRPGFASAYDPTHAEAWVSMLDETSGGDPVQRLFIYDFNRGEWAGEFSYLHQQYLWTPEGMVGFTGLHADRLDVDAINGLPPVEGWIEVPFVPTPGMVSELVAWRLNPDRPDEMRVYDKDGTEMLLASAAAQEAADPGTGAYWVLNIDGWQQLMNSVSQAYATQFGVQQQPPQSTRFRIRWYFRGLDRARVTFASVQARQIA